MKETNWMHVAKEQLKGTYVRYVIILFITSLFASVLNTGLPVQKIVEQPILYIPYFAAMLVLIIGRNTVYFLFIERVRKETFQMEDIKYSIRKGVLHVLSALIFELFQLGLLMLIQMVASIVPVLLLPMIIVMQVLLSSVSVFLAFAIYDGVKGAMHVVTGSFRLLKKEMKTLFFLALPFLIWLLIDQLLSNFLMIQMIEDTTVTTLEMLEGALANVDLQNYAYAYIALDLVNMIISCCLLVPLYTAYANVYDAHYMTCYPFTATIQTNVIDIEQE